MSHDIFKTNRPLVLNLLTHIFQIKILDMMTKAVMALMLDDLECSIKTHIKGCHTSHT